MLARIPRDVCRRLAVLASIVAVLGAACSRLPQATLSVGQGREFVSLVADSQDNVGLAPAVAVSKDGVPFFSYFGFTQKLEPGEIPQTRSTFAPTLPGVLLASLQKNLWERGAAVMASIPPPNVNVAFGPQILPNVASITPINVNGTDVAVDGSGGVHVVWTGNDGVWYASSTAGPSGSYMTAEQVFKVDTPLSQAGPVGWPSVAVDDTGAPYVAFATDLGGGQRIELATKKGGVWNVQDVAVTALCPGCAQPARTEVGITPDGPMVVYADNAAHAVVAATRQGRRWATQTVESNVLGTGLSMAVDKDGNVLVTYYAGNGEVHLGKLSGGSWSVTKVGASGTGDKDAASTETTGVAVDGSGTIYATWVDGDTGAVMLAASPDGLTYTPIPTTETLGGRDPAVGVTADGSAVYLTWYDPVLQDLDVGFYGQTNGLELANPSPIPQGLQTSVRPAVGALCTPSGTKLTIAAPVGASTNGFDKMCLAEAAGKPVSVAFSNQDTFAHNWVVYSANPISNPGAKYLGGETPNTPVTPGQSATFTVKVTAPGTYFFRCDFHPTVMTGSFVVSK